MFVTNSESAVWGASAVVTTSSTWCEAPRSVAHLELVSPVAPPTNDEDLRRWFAREVLPLEQILLRFLRRNWRNAAEIEDLKQDAFARVWEFARHDRPARVKPFIFLVLRNIMIDRLRQQKLVGIDLVADLDRLNVRDDAPDAERQVAARQDLRVLQACLDGLPPRTRQVFMLRKVQGYAQREVATLLGVSEEAVEHRLCNGIRYLKNKLSHFYNQKDSAGFAY